MMKTNCKKGLALATLATVSVSLFGASMAKADGYTCRDYYAAYVDEATNPTPTVVVVGIRPHFHGHYPDYHGGFQGRDGGDGGNHDGGGGNNAQANEVAAIATLAILGALTTTTAVQDAELQDAENVISDIDQAQLGDGAQLRQLLADVQSDLPKGQTATLAEVANAVNIGNEQYSFCAGGNLDSESELAKSIATSLAAAQ